MQGKQMNRIEIMTPEVVGSTIRYNYAVSGEWSEAFCEREPFTIEYGLNIEDVPLGVLMVPLIANVLPMAWVYDADIVCPVCDRDFLESLPQIKMGYKDMFPMMEFKGRVLVDRIQDNYLRDQKGTAAFFSGGVDAFCTLIRHREEKPILITLWGSDISIKDEEGWEKVRSHLLEAGDSFHLDSVVVKSTFRKFLNEGILSRKVQKSGDGWWHGFQHGIGIISHSAPVMYKMGKKTVYFASSFSEADKGKYTCASDPSIDNHVRFCGVRVIHDGYELNRQEKIERITRFSKESGIRIPLRVCWESKGGSNCCHCEKCWRTILGLYAAGADPREFGFSIESLRKTGAEIKRNRSVLRQNKTSRYLPVWKKIREQYTFWTVDPGLRWFYLSSFANLDKGNIFDRAYRKSKNIARRVLKRKQ